VHEAGGDGSTTDVSTRSRRSTADRRVDDAHITTHLATIEEAQFERVKAMCVSLGEVLVRPLAEALSVEARRAPRTADLDPARVRIGRTADDRTSEDSENRPSAGPPSS